ADQQDTDPRLALERMRRTRGQTAPTPPVRVESDARTNSLIVSGAARIMSVAEGLIQELDRDADSASRSWAVFTPTKAPVTALADEARRILENAGGASRIELSALPQSGTIVVVGSTEGTERAKQVLAELDGKAFAAPQADFKVIQLRHVAPDVVVATLSAVLSDRSRWPASLVSAAKAGAPVMEPKVVADALNARVIVTAPAELMSVAVEVVAQLDKPREGDAPVEIRVYSLSEATADTVAKAIEQAVSARAVSRPGRVKPTITPEMTSNSIVVAADPAQLDEIEKTVRDMDVRGPRDAARVRTVFLKKARAGQMAPLVEQLLASEAAQAAQAARGRGGAASQAEPALRVIADERLNAVVISATPTALDAAEEMLKQLDVAPGTESDRTVRVIALRNGDAAEIAKSLADIFETDDGTETPPVIRVNVASNSLLVRANDKQHAMLEAIVSRLDGAALASSRALRSVPLDPSKGDAAEVARLLRRLMQQANGDVEVITVEELLERYDSGDKPGAKPAPAPAGPQGRATDLPAAAPWMVPALPARLVFVGLAFAQAAAPQSDAPPAKPLDAAASGGDGVTVAVDKDSNSLLLLGSPREIERAMKLIEQASKSMPGEASRVRSVRLPASADPAKLASVVNGAIARMTPAGGQAGDLAKRVAVVADEETRSLIVVAGDRDFEAIGQLIAALSRGQAAQQVVVKSFVLRNTGAERVAEGLRAILTQGGGKLRSLAVTLAGEDGAGQPDSFDPSTVRVFAEKGANAVTVVGDSDAVAFADRFVAFADRADRAVVPEVRLVPIRHAKAADVVKSLQTAIVARTRALSAQGVVVSVPEFTADERTNMVVIAGGGDMAAEIERLLGVLDAPTPASGAALEVVAILNGKASEALATVEKVVFAANPALRERAQVVADDGAGVLLMRADAAAREEIMKVVSEIDRSATQKFAIRQVKLERADAQRVATALQKLFDDRAAIAAGGRARGSQRSVSIVADVRSSSLFVTAGEADFAEVSELVKGFDAPETAKSLDFKVYALRHARAGEIAASLEQLLAAMGTGGADDMVSVRGDEKRNSVIIAGRGDRFAFANDFIATVDVAPSESDVRSVRIYAVANGDVAQIAGLVRDTIGE
ncbi:MAG: ral secretion pathway protein, partial [Planctomycetota bacterium]